jgi:hypothetical protein
VKLPAPVVKKQRDLQRDIVLHELGMDFAMHNDAVIDAEAVLETLKSSAGSAVAPGTRQMLVMLGVNLLLFNQIELLFKQVLKTIRPCNGEFDADPLAAIASSLEKQPLGNVAKLLTSLLDPDKASGFGAYLAAVVDSRNQLMHHFLQIPGISLNGDGPTCAARWLKHQHEFCSPLKTMGEQMVVALLYAMERHAAERGEELVVEEWRDHWQ